MRSVPGAVATGSKAHATRESVQDDPVATAPGSDCSALLTHSRIGKAGFHPYLVIRVGPRRVTFRHPYKKETKHGQDKRGTRPARRSGSRNSFEHWRIPAER